MKTTHFPKQHTGFFCSLSPNHESRIPNFESRSTMHDARCTFFADCLPHTAYFVSILLTALLLTVFCGPRQDRKPVLTQISTIDALMAGCYDGVMPVKILHRYGDFGIGAYERVDGEMVMLNDTLFQILADGRAKTAQLPDSTPYAAVIRFKPDRSAALDGPMTLDSLKARLAAAFPNKNLLYAVRVEGIFKSVTTRSVPPQSKPYAPLAGVLAAQQIIVKTENTTGTVVGFYCPAFMKNLNVPGFHLHFVSGDRKTGGHLFDGVLSSGRFDLQACAQFRMILPESGEGFGSADLFRDRSDEMEKVIREPK